MDEIFQENFNPHQSQQIEICRCLAATRLMPVLNATASTATDGKHGRRDRQRDS